MKQLALIVTIVGCAACGPSPLQHAQPSSEALARAVLQAVEQRDAAALRALAVGEQEFEQRVWPELPAARPERNMPWSYVWMELQQKSDGWLKRTLAAHGGRHYTLAAVQFTGPTNHGNYRIFRDNVLLVRDAAGQQQELRILGSVIEADEGWKVFSYVAEQ